MNKAVEYSFAVIFVHSLIQSFTASTRPQDAVYNVAVIINSFSKFMNERKKSFNLFFTKMVRYYLSS